MMRIEIALVWDPPNGLASSCGRFESANQNRGHWLLKGWRCDTLHARPPCLQCTFHIWKGAAHYSNMLPLMCFQCSCSWYVTCLFSPLYCYTTRRDTLLVCDGPYMSIGQILMHVYWTNLVTSLLDKSCCCACIYHCLYTALVLIFGRFRGCQ